LITRQHQPRPIYPKWEKSDLKIIARRYARCGKVIPEARIKVD